MLQMYVVALVSLCANPLAEAQDKYWSKTGFGHWREIYERICL